MKVDRAGRTAVASSGLLAACVGVVLFAFIGSSSSAAAPVELPRPSPAASVFEKIGTAKVTVTYSRPAVKGREIWGALVPWGQVWRLGANDATTLEISEDAKVAGRDLKAGADALFAIPAKGKWTIVVNAQAKQWGAYFRDAKKDVFSFDMTPTAGPHTEWLEFRLHPESAKSLRVEMAWEKLRVSFPVEVDVNGIVWKNLDAARAAAGPKDYVDFYQSARFARETGERKTEAMGWLDEGMKRGEMYAEAAPYLEKAVEASKKAGAPEEWRDGARKKLAEWAAQQNTKARKG